MSYLQIYVNVVKYRKIKTSKGWKKGEVVMKVIVGSIIEKENKILMIQEAKKEFYGKWNFPAGHLEEGETIEEGAIRETIEETGCMVRLKSLLPIEYDVKNEIMVIYFISEMLEENAIVKKDEILEKKWMTIKEIKNIEKDKLRYPDMLLNRLNDIENREKYPLEIIKSIKSSK